MKSPKIKGIGEVVTEYGAKVMKVIKKGLLGRSLFDFYGDVKANAIRVKESSSIPQTPNDKDGGVVYVKNSDGKLYYKSNEVSEVELSANGGTITTDDTPNEGEVLVYNDSTVVWGHPEKIHLQVRNDQGSTIPAGAPLYSKGEIGGSNRIKVGICDANDSAKMPCIGIAHLEMNTTSTKDNFAVVSGIYNTNISGFTSLAVGDNLYIQDNGSLSQTKPTGEASLIQNICIVLKTNGSTCQGMLVSAIGRTNDVPNLNSGHVFYGNSSNQSVSTQLSTLLPPDLTAIKILPRDFIADDGGRPVQIDDTGSDRWIESDSTSPLYASVEIPPGFKATHVDIYGSATSAVTVYEADINVRTVTSKGTGNIGTQINITDVTSDATNYLLIELAQASGEQVNGGKVTIAKA